MNDQSTTKLSPKEFTDLGYIVFYEVQKHLTDAQTRKEITNRSGKCKRITGESRSALGFLSSVSTFKYHKRSEKTRTDQDP